MREIRNTIWRSARDAWVACWRVFFGSFFGVINQGWYLREVGSGVVSGMMPNASLAYALPITGIENAVVVRGILDRDMDRFLRREGLTIVSNGNDIISFQLSGADGVFARLRILKQGWQFIVPSNYFSGSSYAAMERKWDAVAVEIAMVLSGHYS